MLCAISICVRETGCGLVESNMRAAPRELAEQLWALCLGCLGNVTNPRTAHPKQVVRPWERPRESSREVSYSWFLTLRCREIYGTGVTTMEQQVEFGSIRRWNHLLDRVRIAGKARARAATTPPTPYAPTERRASRRLRAARAHRHRPSKRQNSRLQAAKGLDDIAAASQADHVR